MCGDVEKLIKRRKTQDKQPVYYAIMEDKYDIISRGHITTDHGGRDRMLKHLCQKYANSTSRSCWTQQVLLPCVSEEMKTSKNHRCCCELGIVDALACHEPLWAEDQRYWKSLPMDVLPNDLAILRSVIY